MYLTLILLPAYGALVSGLLGRKLGATGAQLITTSCITVSAVLSIVSFYEVSVLGLSTTVSVSEWISSELLQVSWAFTYDSLTVSMLVPVLVVSSAVHLFSMDYMAGDPHTQRFFSYLSMFTFFMLLLVAGNNYLVLFIGWEGIGVSSYLLVNYWYTRVQANKSAMKAMIVNRVGDTSLSVAFFGLFALGGSLDYSALYAIAPMVNEDLVVVSGLLLLFAAMGKSAQFGLHTWLPDAMEGPTPVSALIHAATLVTAGVYLLMRSSPLLEYGTTALIAITWVGAVTAFFAASTGLFQNDLKRVIAYSTCSQMGYLFMACGLSQYNVGLFHLVNHAFFKALLFLAAGAVLHATYDQQDQRRLGGLLGLLPFTYVCILIGSLSLMAVPFMTGFYSKDLILEAAYGQYELSGHYAYWLGTLAAGITATYSFRLIGLTFLSYPNASRTTYATAHDAPVIVIVPLTVLSLLAIFFGYVTRDLFVGLGSDFVGSALFTHPSHVALVEAEFGLPTAIKLLPAIITLLGATMAFFTYQASVATPPTLTLGNAYRSVVYGFYSSMGPTLRAVYGFFNGKYYVDVVYNRYVVGTVFSGGYSISKVLDRGVVELLGPHGLSQGLVNSSTAIGRMDTGYLTDYALYMAIAMVALTNIVLNAMYQYSDTVPTLTLLMLATTLVTATAHKQSD